MSTGFDAVNFFIQMPVERDFVPNDAFAVPVWLRQPASCDFLAKSPRAQSQIGGRRFLRVAPRGGTVPREPF